MIDTLEQIYKLHIVFDCENRYERIARITVQIKTIFLHGTFYCIKPKSSNHLNI